MDPAQLPAVIELSRFSVSFNRRELLAEDRPLDFGGRTFDHLVVQDIRCRREQRRAARRIWPDRIVEEKNPQAQIPALRRALGRTAL